ncbi:MAG: hypothetical protein ACYTG0_07725 [Planctomycetota bacterium]|jgi:endonuclease-3
MASPSRTSQLQKIQKVLKKHYQAVAPDPNRTVFEHLLFAGCLENAQYEQAELAFAALADTGNFFDWNEIRVSTVRELAEAMVCLPGPPAAANRVKRVLQSVFESAYSFDLEDLRKQNLGSAVERIKRLDGTTPFSVAYVVQSALGGHAIPVDAGVLRALHVVELVTEKDVKAGVVPGLERAIIKSKGLEFGSQIHQFGADFFANPYSRSVREILLEINPAARPRLPKRRARKDSGLAAEETTQPAAAGEAAKPPEKSDPVAAKQKPAESKRKRPDRKAEPADGPSTERKTDAPRKGSSSGKGSGSAEEPSSGAAKKKPHSSKKRASAKKKADAGEGDSGAKSGTRKSASTGLSRRKPR